MYQRRLPDCSKRVILITFYNLKVLHINTALVTDAPGRIAEEIGKVLISNGHENYIGYGRYSRSITSEPVRIGNIRDQMLHVLMTRLLDQHGFWSTAATKKFTEDISRIDPDVIHLHNLHGYYLNVEVLFKYLKSAGKPVVWTMHDCWPFTGHCSHYDYVGCNRWKTKCFSCPNKKAYPSSWFMDNSTGNFFRKKEIFTGLDSMHIVAPSEWLANQVKESFLKNYPVEVLSNGVNLSIFKPKSENDTLKLRYGLSGKKIILGVASFWGRHKGLEDFIRLSDLISDDSVIVLIGLNKKQQEGLPVNITGLSRTENIDELAAFYSAADVFVNPTYVDTFPTTNLEALACGTPVVTYNTGGSPESLDFETGMVVEKGDLSALFAAVDSILDQGKAIFTKKCLARAELLYNKESCYLKYLELYYRLLS
jgi:putative colanic acid biosynthesis glycosyltransferase